MNDQSRIILPSDGVPLTPLLEEEDLQRLKGFSVPNLNLRTTCEKGVVNFSTDVQRALIMVMPFRCMPPTNVAADWHRIPGAAGCLSACEIGEEESGYMEFHRINKVFVVCGAHLDRLRNRDCFLSNPTQLIGVEDDQCKLLSALKLKQWQSVEGASKFLFHPRVTLLIGDGVIMDCFSTQSGEKQLFEALLAMGTPH